MMSVDQIYQVRKLKEIDCLPIREIAKRLGISRNTVRKILRSNRTKFQYSREYEPRPAVDGIYELLEKWLQEDLQLKKKQRRTARRMHEILVTEYQYPGSYRSVARCLREIKSQMGQRSMEAFIPLYFSPGEVFQFDWGEVAAYIGGVYMVLQLAVIQLAHSRVFFAKAYPSQKQELMFDAHCRAFEFFGGSCKRGIYDNLKQAVTRILKGRQRELSPNFVRLVSHYIFKPEFCNVAKGNEKGRVENLIGTIRRNFFAPVPRFASLEDLNSALKSFSVAQARQRLHPEFNHLSRYEVFLKEKEYLVSLPGFPFECCRVDYSVVSPFSLVKFDSNRYSVPTEFVGKTLLIKGFHDELHAIHEGRLAARHIRTYRKNHTVYNPVHYLNLLVKKPRAIHDGLPFKCWNLPAVFYRYKQLLERKVENPDKYFADTLFLLKEWPVNQVAEALKSALSQKLIGSEYILNLIRRKQCSIPESIPYKLNSNLSKYSAMQKDTSHYDQVLRGRS